MIIAHRPNVGHSTVMQNMYKQETELAHRVVKSAGCKAHIVVKSAPLCSAFGWDWLNLQICSRLVNLWVKLHKQFWFFPLLLFYRFDCAFTEEFLFPFSICFRDMCSGLKKVRRLSTASSVTKPPHFILTTEWIWYWKDEYGTWQEYGKQVSVEKWTDSSLCVRSAELLRSTQCLYPPPLLSPSSSHLYRWTLKA